MKVANALCLAMIYYAASLSDGARLKLIPPPTTNIVEREINEHGPNELGPDDFEEAHNQNITIPIIDADHPDPVESESDHETERQTVPGSAWPNGVVYYYIDNVFSSKQRGQIAKAIQEIEDKTCVKFKAATSGTQNYIYITDKYYCYSTSIGRAPAGTGRQDISLGRQGCLYHGIIVHEFMHALGFHHEQNRADRDQYVTINWDNIRTDRYSQFKKVENAEDHGSPYDYYSLMHYAKWDFNSNGGQTITPKQNVTESGECQKIGQRCGMSSEDVKQMNALYNCGANGGDEGGDGGDEGGDGGSGGSDCKDIRPTDWCQNYIYACTDNRYPWFKRDCKKTCNNCGGSSCSDHYGAEYCQQYSWGCTGENQWYQWFRQGCKNTCGIC